MKKTIVTLGLYRLSIPHKIETVRSYLTSMTGNPRFPTPNPSLGSIKTATDALEAAYLAAQGGGVEATANMHAKEHTVDVQVKMLGDYVEGIANADPLNAEAIVLSAGMSVRASNTRTAKEFNARCTSIGEVKLMTKGVKHATFMWQMCTDTSAESNWQTIGMGTQAKFVKNGLTSGTRYYFRVAVVDKNGQGPWSNVVNLIVQ